MSERPAMKDVQLGAAALHALIEHAPDGIFVADIEGRYIYVNEAGCRMLGYSRDELLRMTIHDALPAGDPGRLARSKAVMLEGRTDAAEWTLRRKDGTLLAGRGECEHPPQRPVARIRARHFGAQGPPGRARGPVRADRSRPAPAADRGRHLAARRVAVRAGRHSDRQSAHARSSLGMKLVPAGRKRAVRQAASSIPTARRCRRRSSWPRACGAGETIIAEEFLVRRPDGTQLPRARQCRADPRCRTDSPSAASACSRT